MVGARPQFIKAAPVSRVLRRQHREVLVHTGQHYDDEMSALFFRELRVPEADHNLGVGSGPHGWQTAAMLTGIEELALRERPDWMLVYGDTNSTLAGALVAAKLHIPLAHVEAGLRSYDRRMPEEVNRVLTDHVSDLCFCPTERAVHKLAKEGIEAGVHQVGDVMYDALLQHQEAAEARSSLLEGHGLRRGSYVLVTVHRAENTDDADRLRRILKGVGASGLDAIFPVHPRTRAVLARLEYRSGPRLKMTEPVGYLEMLALERHAAVIVTDSGGVQKEAYVQGIPCVTVRDRTEWTETVDGGWNLLVDDDPAAISRAITDFRPSGERPQVFGDGQAASAIVDLLERAGR